MFVSFGGCDMRRFGAKPPGISFALISQPGSLGFFEKSWPEVTEYVFC